MATATKRTYRVREGFSVHIQEYIVKEDGSRVAKPLKSYDGGEDVELSPEQFKAHEHKLEAPPEAKKPA